MRLAIRSTVAVGTVALCGCGGHTVLPAASPSAAPRVHLPHPTKARVRWYVDPPRFDDRGLSDTLKRSGVHLNGSPRKAADHASGHPVRRNPTLLAPAAMSTPPTGSRAEVRRDRSAVARAYSRLPRVAAPAVLPRRLLGDGSGSVQLGTLLMPMVLHWTSRNSIRLVARAPFGARVLKGRSGRVTLAAGAYGSVNVVTSGVWRFELAQATASG